MTLSPGTRLGRYVVESLLGAGGMGEVYLAQDPVLARRVAIKVLQGDRQDEDLLHRFEQEALAASALNHPHILTIYEFGTENGLRFLACEHVEGLSVRQRLRRSAPLPLREAVRIALQTAAALDAAHRAGIVHRDIKPENVMVRPDGYVKVLDFGLAKRMTPPGPMADARTVLTSMPGTILGTVVYMSPEQARGMAVDTRADVWSLGCVLYEMASGRAPFDGQSPMDVLAAILDRQPQEVTDARPDCPPALAALIHRMLLKDREARVQSMAAVVDELGSIERQLDPAPRLESASRPADSAARAAERTSGRAPFRWTHPALIAGLLVMAVVAAIALMSRSGERQAGREAVPPVESRASSSVAGVARRIEYWLTVQPMRDGSPDGGSFESAGGRVYGNGWRFRLNVSSPRRGHLYVLNEGPDEGGRTTLVILHSGELRPGESALGWNRFTDHSGTEQLWLVSSPSPVPELEALTPLMNPDDRGLVGDPGRVESLKQLLIRHQVSPRDLETDVERQRIVLRASDAVSAHLLKLEHH